MQIIKVIMNTKIVCFLLIAIFIAVIIILNLLETYNYELFKTQQFSEQSMVVEDSLTGKNTSLRYASVVLSSNIELIGLEEIKVNKHICSSFKNTNFDQIVTFLKIRREEFKVDKNSNINFEKGLKIIKNECK